MEDALPAFLHVAEDDGTTLASAWASVRLAWEGRLAGNRIVAASADGPVGAARKALEAYEAAERHLARARGLVRMEDLAAVDRCGHDRICRAADATEKPLQANLSLVCLRLGDWAGAERRAAACLALDPGHVKARCRRARALLELGRLADAEGDLQAAISLEPGSRDARELLRLCRRGAPSGDDREAVVLSELSPAARAPERPPGLDAVAPPIASEWAAALPACDAGEPLEAVLGGLWAQLGRPGGRGGGLGFAARAAAEAWAASGPGRARRLLLSSVPRGWSAADSEPLLAALCRAVGREEQQLAAALLLQLGGEERDALLGRRLGGGASPLHLAAVAGAEGLVEALLDVHADPELTDEEERTPLHHAALAGHERVAGLLLDAPCAADPQDRHSRTPLYYAGVSGHKVLAGLLVTRGKADQSILFHALKEKFGTHNYYLHDWPEYNGRWMTSKEGRAADVPLRRPAPLPFGPDELQRGGAAASAVGNKRVPLAS
ncbi:unnamed protein product, partial [Prorocentrum cordatum]